MPSCSIGFCVANTRYGASIGCVTPPAVTRCSSIACSSAAWVLGGVRLISSASSTLVNTGPGTNRKRRWPVVGLLLEHVRAGDVGGHQVGRELDAVALERERLREARDERGLGQAGHADEQAVAAREQGDQQQLDHRLLADDARRSCSMISRLASASIATSSTSLPAAVPAAVPAVAAAVLDDAALRVSTGDCMRFGRFRLALRVVLRQRFAGFVDGLA